MQQRIAPSVQIEAAIEAVLTGGLGDPDALSTLGRLGAKLVLQRAVEDEVSTFLANPGSTCPPRLSGAETTNQVPI